jgi:flagellar biogenesis protein FliO
MAGVGGRPRRRLSVIETVPLDARTRLALVRCDAREYLLALGPNGVTRIAGPVSAPPALAVPPGSTEGTAR